MNTGGGGDGGDSGGSGDSGGGGDGGDGGGGGQPVALHELGNKSSFKQLLKIESHCNWPISEIFQLDSVLLNADA